MFAYYERSEYSPSSAFSLFNSHKNLNCEAPESYDAECGQQLKAVEITLRGLLALRSAADVEPSHLPSLFTICNKTES